MSAFARARIAMGLSAIVLLIVLGIAVPRAAAYGWMIAFSMVSAASLGALALLLIHRLTGGAWGDAAGPRLVRLSQMLPMSVLWFVVLLLLAPLIYPWIKDPAAAGPGVARLYLNLPLFAIRGAVVLIGLSFVAYVVPRGGSRLVVGLALVLYAVGIDLVAVDWLLSIEPRYTSSAFGAQIIIAQMVVALSLVLFDGTPRIDPRPRADLAALLLACLLGESYLILITMIVHWYGNLPDQAAWFLRRTDGGWRWLAVFGTIAGSALPIAALMFQRVRRSPTWSGVAAAAALLGIFIEMVWLVAPMAGPLAFLAAVLALAGLACLTPDVGSLMDRPMRSVRHGL